MRALARNTKDFHVLPAIGARAMLPVLRFVDGGRAVVRGTRLSLLLLAAALGCSEGGRGPAAAPETDGGASSGDGPGTELLYALGQTPLRFGDVPYPDDAYLDAEGHVRVTHLPSAADESYTQALAEGLAQLDGFGARPTVYLRFEAALDPASLPRDPAASVADAASVLMLDADTASPTAFERVAIDVGYHAARRELRVAPAYGRALVAGRRYAVVVTDDVTDASGRPVERAAQLGRILDPRAVLEDAQERAARARYEPVLQGLAQRGVPRARVVGLAAFRVQSAGSDLLDARASLHAGPLPAIEWSSIVAEAELDGVLGTPPAGAIGLDDGAPHEQIGALAHGSFALPDFSSTEGGERAGWQRGERGSLLAHGLGQQHFTLFLPRNPAGGAAPPVIVVLHDEEGERSDAAAIANALCGVGYAVVAPDAPFHGLRSSFGDVRTRFTGVYTPDGFGDGAGDFAGLDDEGGALQPGHPFYYRDAVRQYAADVLGLLRVLREGDLSPLAPALPSGRLLTTRIGLLGIGVGAEVATLVAPHEPSVDSLVLAFPGNGGVEGWLGAPRRRGQAAALIERLGGDYEEIDWERDPPAAWPDVDVYRALTDRASLLLHAADVRRAPLNLLLLMARDDEVAPNLRTEAFAAALGVHLALGQPLADPALVSDERLPGDSVRSNVSLEAGDLTRSLVVLEPATHEALQLERAEQAFAPPLTPPFELRDSPEGVDNPLEEALEQVVYFFESVRRCEPSAATPCAATVLVP